MRDKQQFSDPRGEAEAEGISSATWSMFGVVWESSQVLANYVVDLDVGGKRILEVGCGIGLASLLLNQRAMDISATDHHPEAGQMLQRNALLNGAPDIPFVRTRWEEGDSGLGTFDLVIGSDLLYDQRHLPELALFINKHAKPESEIVIVDPGRGECARFSKLLNGYGFADHPYLSPEADYLADVFKGRILRFER